MDPKEMDPKSNLITTLKELKYAIEEGDINKLKVKINWFYQDLKRNSQLLFDLYKSGNQYVSRTELILTACRNNQADVLYYLLYETDILDYFPDADFSDSEANSKRTEAFKLALIWDAFNMVEMLYDYWSGDLHWIGHDIKKIEALGKLLEDAFVVCIVETQQLLIDIHSLMQFNAFQQTLYSSISKKTKEKTVEMLVEMLQIYDKYSQLEMVRLPHEDEEQERMLQACIEDSSDYMKIQIYIKYEVYFRKLDFNVALILTENIHVLRKYLTQRLKQPESYFAKNSGVISLYKQIEYVLFNFIYHTCEDWSLYLPGNRQSTREEHHTGIHKGREKHNLIINYDKHKLFYGPLLFLQRKNYYNRLTELKSILSEKHVISEDPANVEDRQILLDENYVASTYMSGYYSLSKMVYYLKAIENKDNVNVLMIERVLQVVGEMLKTSGDSNCPLDSIKMLLRMEMSEKTIENLSNISNFLSRADEGQLTKRIDIARKQADVFDKIKQDLKVMKQIIDTILDFYKGILDISFLEEGLRLLDERIKQLPDESSRHMDEIVQCFKIHGQELLVSGPVLLKLTEDTGLTPLCLKEMIWICVNKDDLLSKTNSANESINKKLVSILKTYIQNTRQTLEPIHEIHKNVNSINSDLVNHNLEKVSDNDKNEDLSNGQVENFSHHNREKINKMLSFFFDKCTLLGPKSEENLLAFTDILLEELNKKREPPSSSKNLAGEHSFEGIEELHAIFQEHKSPQIVREQLIASLISRVNQMKETLGYPQHMLEENLRRYKYDLQFRFELEMVLADIVNILKTLDIKSLMNKSGKLLRDIDLGDVLNHGNLFLEVLGNVFDSTDLSTALLSKAIRFAEDGESIEALFKLLQGGIDYDIVKKGKVEEMNDEQSKLYKKILKSPNWEIYARMQRG